MNSKIDVGFLLTEKDRVINELKKQHLEQYIFEVLAKRKGKIQLPSKIIGLYVIL